MSEISTVMPLEMTCKRAVKGWSRGGSEATAGVLSLSYTQQAVFKLLICLHHAQLQLLLNA